MVVIQNTKASFDGFFTRQLTAYLEQPKEVRHTQVVRPSQITECKRWIIADLLGMSLPEDLGARTYRIFDNGTYVHKRYLQRYLPKMGCAIQIYDLKTKAVKPFIEVMLYDEDYWLKGAPDALIFNTEDGLPYIFELKSMREFQFRNLTEPLPEHVAQVHLYMYLTNVPRAIVFYESKDTQETKEFVVELDNTYLTTLLNRIREIQQAVLNYPTTQQLPPCEYPEAKVCPCRDITTISQGGVL